MIKTEREYEKYRPTVWVEWPTKDQAPGDTVINTCEQKENKMIEHEEQMYYIVSQEDQPSRHGGYITVIKMINLHTGEEAKTYIDERNRNYRNWHEIVNHPGWGFVIDHLKLKRPGLISADSRPEIQKHTRDQQAMEPTIIDYLNRELYNQKTAEPLFEIKEN